MQNYLIISSRGSFESADGGRLLQLVRGIRARNHGVTLFLVQNGVLDARVGACHGEGYRRLAEAGVAVIADSFSLRERAIDDLADGVKVGNIDQLVDLMVEPGTKAFWH